MYKLYQKFIFSLFFVLLAALILRYRLILWTFLSLMLLTNICSGQKYFEFYYTNTAAEQEKKYRMSYGFAEDCVFAGNTKYRNSKCDALFPVNKFSHDELNSLHNTYVKYLPDSVYTKYWKYILCRYYHAEDKSAGHYVIKTFYRIDENTPVALYQVRINFTDTERDGVFEVESVQVFSARNVQKFDLKTVLAQYKKQEEEAKSEDPIEMREK